MRKNTAETLYMITSELVAMKFILLVRYLQDAYLEGAFDKVKNHLYQIKKKVRGTRRVKIWRKII